MEYKITKEEMSICFSLSYHYVCPNASDIYTRREDNL